MIVNLNDSFANSVLRQAPWFQIGGDENHQFVKTVERAAEASLPTKIGGFRIIGYFNSENSPLVRIHSQCLTGDVFGSIKCDCGQQLEAAVRLIAEENCGAIVYQQQEGRGIGIINKIRAYALQDKGADTIEANERLGLDVDLRRYEQCAEILLDLGLKKIRLMSNNPEKIRALKNSGLEIAGRVPLSIEYHRNLTGYLKTKRDSLGHLINLPEEVFD
jgi:GTP cyclohydrolase II